MNIRKLSRWALLIAAGCNGKLSVSTDGGSAGTGADAGASASAGADADSDAGAGGRGAHGGTAGDASIEERAGTSGIHDFPGGGGSGGSERNDQGGSGGVVVAPGQLREACIPGGLVTEADGSPAKAEINTLIRCDEGLSCNAQGKCALAPACPQNNGLCLVRQADVSGAGGYGGGAGATAAIAGGSPPAGGDGNSIPNAIAETGVVALTANDSNLYWLEYGTRDALGNAQDDGALMSYSMTSGTTVTLLSGLAGPVGLELTSSHLYLYVDGAPQLSTPTSPKLLRMPLAGGSAELVQEGTTHGPFAAAGSTAFWVKGNQLYSMLSDSDASPTLFVADVSHYLPMASDATDLYYSTTSGALMLTPLASAAPVPLGLSASDLALHDDGIFTLTNSNAGSLLARAAKSGGEFVPVRALGAGSSSHLTVKGDRYFLEVRTAPIKGDDGQYTFTSQILTASFVGDDPPVRLLERPARLSLIDELWVGTANALYWSEGRNIYRQPLPTQ